MNTFTLQFSKKHKSFNFSSNWLWNESLLFCNNIFLSRVLPVCPAKVAPEPLETTFHLNIIYLTFKFLKPVQKAMCGKECQSQHPTVNLSREHTQCNKSPEQQTAQQLYIINNVSIKPLHQSYLLQHVKFSICVMQRLGNMCDCCHAMIQSVVYMYKKV